MKSEKIRLTQINERLVEDIQKLEKQIENKKLQLEEVLLKEKQDWETINEKMKQMNNDLNLTKLELDKQILISN